MFPLLMWWKLSNCAVYIFLGSCFRVYSLLPGPGQTGAIWSLNVKPLSHFGLMLLIVSLAISLGQMVEDK